MKAEIADKPAKKCDILPHLLSPLLNCHGRKKIIKKKSMYKEDILWTIIEGITYLMY